jgi:hypothetical protein
MHNIIERSIVVGVQSKAKNPNNPPDYAQRKNTLSMWANKYLHS